MEAHYDCQLGLLLDFFNHIFKLQTIKSWKVSSKVSDTKQVIWIHERHTDKSMQFFPFKIDFLWCGFDKTAGRT